MDTNGRTAMQILHEAGAVMTGLHVVYTSGRHGSDYVNKDGVNVEPVGLSELAGIIAAHVLASVSDSVSIDTVAAPAMGAISLGSHVGLQLHQRGVGGIKTVYAEHVTTSIVGNDTKEVTTYLLEEEVRDGHKTDISLRPGEQLVRKEKGFAFGRGQLKHIKGKNVLVVEDILSTGGSAKLVVEAVREAGGNVVGVACICNRGKVTAEMLGVPHLWSAVEVDMAMHEASACPLCKEGVPITTGVGHGKEYLAQRGLSA